MTKVIYQYSDGSSLTVDATAGESIMQTAMDNNISGILGMCDGCCNCGTCHVYVDESWLAKLPAISEQEEMMLDGVPADRLANSRLSCQIKLTNELDGIVVTLPDIQQ